MNAVRENVENIPIGLLLQHLKRPSKSDISQNIKRKPASPHIGIHSSPPPRAVTGRSSFRPCLRLTAHDIAERPHMLQNVVLHRLDHFSGERLR